MTIIQSGQSIPLSLSAGQSLVVKDMSGTSSVTGSVTREDAQSRIGQGFFVYGPVASAASVTLTTTGVTDYQIVNGDPTPANQQMLFDPGNPPTSGPTLSGASADAVQNATGLVKNEDGSVNLQIVPRTGTLSSLQGLAGSSGEIASATDSRQLVQFTGAVGEAACFQPDGTMTVNISGTGFVTQPILQPVAGHIVLTKAASVNQTINGFGRLADGLYPMQEIEIINLTGFSQTAYHNGGATGGNAAFDNNMALTFRWVSGAWKCQSGRRVDNASGLGALAVGSATASGLGSLASGAGVASGLSATALTSGTASGDSSVALVGGTSSGLNSFAFKGQAQGVQSCSLGGTAKFKNSIARSRQAVVGATGGYAAQSSEALLSGRTTDGTTDVILSLNGGAPVDMSDLLDAAGWTGVRRFVVTIVGHVTGTAGVLVMRRSGIWRSITNGTSSALIGAVATEGTDIISGITGTPTITITADPTTFDLRLTARGVASTNIVWNAKVEFQEIIA